MSPERRDKKERKISGTRKRALHRGIRTVIEELKQQLHAKTAKLKRYDERMNQHKINRMLVQTQKRVYQQMDDIRNIMKNQMLKRVNNFGVTKLTTLHQRIANE